MQTAIRRPDGSTFGYQYDEENQLDSTTVPGEIDIKHVYDGLGRPTEVSRGSGNKTKYGYDDRGYLNSSKTNANEVTYINDAAGRVISMTYPENQVVSYGYDSSNAVTDISAQQGASNLIIAEYEYDNMGRLTDVLLGDGGLTTYQYDDIGRLERHTLADFHIYNPANQIVRRSVTDGAMQTALPNSRPDQYTPNNLNQYRSAV